jgi:exosortase
MNVESLKNNSRRWLGAGCFVLLAGWMLWRLWVLDALGPLPLGLAAVVLVLWRDIAADLPRTPRAVGVPWVALLAGGVYVGGVLIDSSFVQLVSLGGLGAAWIIGVAGWQRSGALLVLIGLVSLPQGLVQETIFVHLQRFAAGMASWGLDLAGMPHLRQGAVLETTRGDLFVEEACSGMRSLLTGLVAGQAYLAWKRKGVVFSVFYLAGCMFLLMMGNCLRIFGISFLLVRFGVDWTRGWVHDAMGMVVFIGVLALMPGLRLLLERVAAGYVRWRYPWVEPMQDWSEQCAVAVPHPGHRFEMPRIMVERMPGAVLVAVIVMTAAGLAGRLLSGGDEVPVFGAEGAYPHLVRVELPEELGGWKQEVGAREVTVVEKYGLDQHVWCFRKDGLTAWVAADLPFDQLHQLRVCYRNRDWLVVGEGETSGSAGGKFAKLELRSKEGERPPMLVLFDNFDLIGKTYVGGGPRPLASRWGRVLERFRRGSPEARGSAKGPFCQVQVVVQGVPSLESPTGAQARRLFVEARAALGEGLSRQIPD